MIALDPAHRDSLIAFRRELHADPELRFEEHRTAARIERRLRAAGFSPRTGLAGTGIVATIEGALPGPSIVLRAELDALPIQETTGLPWASQVEGRMHACGHDGHAAMLLGAAECLIKAPPARGTVHVVFQPGEEGGAGARVMMEQGLFDAHPADACFSVHNWPGLALGRMALRHGPIMAGGRRFRIVVTGRGAHAAQPHKADDPVFAAASLVVALQSLVSRRVDPAVPAVVSVCTLQGGRTDNIIPDEVVMTGTLRALSEETLLGLCQGMETVADGIALAHSVRVDVAFHQPYPVTANDPAEADLAARAMEELTGPGSVDRSTPPNLTSDDFGFMLQGRPGAYVLLGNGDTAPLHSSAYDFDDALIEHGVAYWLALVERFMAERGAGRTIRS